MKNKNWMAIFSTFALPVLLMLLGLVLVIHPDSAAALIGKLTALVVILSGGAMGISVLAGDPYRRVRRLIPAAVTLVLGLWLLANPLFIARSLGRVLGVLLVLEGGSDLIGALRRGYPFPVMAVITLVAGAVLALVPMATSRLLFTLCGILLLCIGAAELAEKLLCRGKKPDIIDL